VASHAANLRTLSILWDAVRREGGTPVRCRHTSEETPEMHKYLLAIYRDDEQRPEEEFRQTYEDVNVLADELNAAARLVFAGGLNHATPTVLRSVDGRIVATDGPFAETKEYLGGFWIIEENDIDSARKWGAKLAVALRRPIEVSTFEDDDATVEELYNSPNTTSTRIA
jgi:hypothetical protein